MIRSLQHVAIAVPDLDKGREFYTAMGLEGRAIENGWAFRCAGRAQDQVRLFRGPKKRLLHVSWGTRAEELPGMQRRLESAGVKLEEAPVKENGEGICFRDPDGILVNVRAVDEAPQTRPAVAINNPGETYRRLGRRGAPGRNIDAHPRKLGHLLKFTTDVNRDVDFYTRLLGMKLSDRIGADFACFLRCGGDSDHHTMALAKSEAPGLHHLSFEMGNLDQLQICAERMVAAGYRDGWGTGRHIYGSNYFHYVRDPWMGLTEFYWDIDFIPEGAAWEVEVAEPGPEALYQWATTPPPEDFLKNYEVLQQEEVA